MPFNLDNGNKGLLSKNEWRKTVDAALPNLLGELKKVDHNDSRLLAALFRDYSMVSAGYMLESCHLSYLEKKWYGRGSDFIPEQLAVPMKYAAEAIGYKQPILDYAHGYSLNNWMFVNDKNPESAEYDNDQIVTDLEKPINNFKLIRKLNGCRDEAGFVLLHISIVSKTYKQVKAYEKLF